MNKNTSFLSQIIELELLTQRFIAWPMVPVIHKFNIYNSFVCHLLVIVLTQLWFFLDVFKFDPDYEANEEKYKSLVNIDSDEESDEEGSSGSGDSDDGEILNTPLILFEKYGFQEGFC